MAGLERVPSLVDLRPPPLSSASRVSPSSSSLFSGIYLAPSSSIRSVSTGGSRRLRGPSRISDPPSESRVYRDSSLPCLSESAAAWSVAGPSFPGSVQCAVSSKHVAPCQLRLPQRDTRSPDFSGRFGSTRDRRGGSEAQENQTESRPFEIFAPTAVPGVSRRCRAFRSLASVFRFFAVNPVGLLLLGLSLGAGVVLFNWGSSPFLSSVSSVDSPLLADVSASSAESDDAWVLLDLPRTSPSLFLFWREKFFDATALAPLSEFFARLRSGFAALPAWLATAISVECLYTSFLVTVSVGAAAASVFLSAAVLAFLLPVSFAFLSALCLAPVAGLIPLLAGGVCVLYRVTICIVGVCLSCILAYLAIVLCWALLCLFH
ncbi:UNVERIFIED_CONTAM: hypothetical protein HHA_268178 [Hammondia hammondi]|eukprot:XP_008882219.1 hypothetical protein HHA_268178 [Hammondia hammondi]